MPGITVNSSVPTALLGITESFKAELSQEGPGWMFGWILLSPGFPLKPRHKASAPAALSSWQGKQKEGQILLLSLRMCLQDVCRDSFSQLLCAWLSLSHAPSALACRPPASAAHAADMLCSVAVVGVWERKAISSVATC